MLPFFVRHVILVILHLLSRLIWARHREAPIPPTGVTFRDKKGMRWAESARTYRQLERDLEVNSTHGDGKERLKSAAEASWLERRAP